MQQFYTLEEAARLLGISPDELKKMAERNEVRAFRDRGSMRFRGPEIDEMARRRGRGSDPDLQLGEAPPRRTGTSPPPQKAAPKPEGEVFDFQLNTEDSDQVEIGQELHLDSPSGSHKGSSRKLTGSKSPPPKPGSDSDVRLVPDGSDLDFKIASDSDVKMVDEPGPGSKLHKSPPPKRKTGSSKSRIDSGVQMVPLEGQPDSDVKMGEDSGSSVPLGQSPLKTPSDSDIRLESSPGPRKSKLSPGPKRGPVDPMLTEEIDLDAELRRAEEQARARKPGKKRQTKSTQAAPPLPATSPFELSQDDLDLPLPKQDEPASVTDSSSDFDLTPAADLSPTAPSSDEMPAVASEDDDEVSLGELSGSAGASGINLQDPADSGISLEQEGSSDEIEFELSLEDQATPRPAPASAPRKVAPDDSDSEFELSLDEGPGSSSEGSSEVEAASSSPTSDSDSEFELSLDAEGELAGDSSPTDSSPVDSDSEFELTLDDSGGLAPLDEEASGEAASEDESGEKDIFETDFEVPALDDESGSQAVALDDADTDLESSDFDLALDEGDAESEDESGSQVVALEDEEEVDEAAETVARPRRQRGAPVIAEGEDSDEVEELFDVGEDEAAAEDEEEEEAVGAPARAGGVVAVAPRPAEWGVLPALVMLPCVVVLFVVALMSYELVRRDGTNNPNLVTKAIAGLFESK